MRKSTGEKSISHFGEYASCTSVLYDHTSSPFFRTSATRALELLYITGSSTQMSTAERPEPDPSSYRAGVGDIEIRFLIPAWCMLNAHCLMVGYRFEHLPISSAL